MTPHVHISSAEWILDTLPPSKVHFVLTSVLASDSFGFLPETVQKG